jgi:hypothetical protein
MAEPTLEAMRQAFLDHEARIICSWDNEFAQLRKQFTEKTQRIKQILRQVRIEGQQTVADFMKERDSSEWWKSVLAADQDAKAYATELQAKGIDPKAYGDLQRRLLSQQALLKHPYCNSTYKERPHHLAQPTTASR